MAVFDLVKDNLALAGAIIGLKEIMLDEAGIAYTDFHARDCQPACLQELLQGSVAPMR